MWEGLFRVGAGGQRTPISDRLQLDATDDQPSCSLVEALEKQSLFINRAMALHGLNLLWKLFRTARLEAHGVFVNLATDRTSPLLIGPDTWGRFGYQVKEAA